MTIEAIGADMVELMPELARYVPPAETIDKHVYSPWWALTCCNGSATGNPIRWW